MPIYRIAASILACNLARRVVAAGADWIHFDVMDNHYVPNLSIGPMVYAAVREHAATPDGSPPTIDVHLMVRPVDALAHAFAEAWADRVRFHVDASSNVNRTLQHIKTDGARVGLAFNPAFIDSARRKLARVRTSSAAGKPCGI